MANLTDPTRSNHSAASARPSDPQDETQSTQNCFKALGNCACKLGSSACNKTKGCLSASLIYLKNNPKKISSCILLMGLVALIVLIACHHKKAGSVIKNFINKDSTNNFAIAAGAGGAAALALARDRREAKKAVATEDNNTNDAIRRNATGDPVQDDAALRSEVASEARKHQKENWSFYQLIMAVLAIAFIGLAVNKAIPKSAQHIYQKVMEGIGAGAAIPVIRGLLKTSFSSDDNNRQTLEANNQ